MYFYSVSVPTVNQSSYSDVVPEILYIKLKNCIGR